MPQFNDNAGRMIDVQMEESDPAYNVSIFVSKNGRWIELFIQDPDEQHTTLIARIQKLREGTSFKLNGEVHTVFDPPITNEQLEQVPFVPIDDNGDAVGEMMGKNP